MIKIIINIIKKNWNINTINITNINKLNNIYINNNKNDIIISFNI